MRNMILVGCCAVLALSVLSGCNKLAEKASDEAAERIAEAAIGGDADVEIDGDQVKITGEDGSVSTIAGGPGELPEGWPASLPQYPGSQINGSSSSSEGDQVAYSVSLSTGDSPEQVMKFYEEKALAGGFSKLSSVSGAGRFTDHYSNDKWMFNVNCGAEGGNTGVMLMLGMHDGAGGSGSAPGNGGGENDEPIEMHSGKLPTGFPVDVIKLYPGAEINNAASRGKEHLLTQTTADAVATVVKFYEDHFAGRGWNKATSIDSEMNSMRGFESKAGEIVLTVAPQESGTFITLVYTQK